MIETNSKAELEKEIAELECSESGIQTDNSKDIKNSYPETEPPKYVKEEDLEKKKKELVCCIFIFWNNLKWLVL